ncbi:class I SAM-dependent methyltransferase [Campylobacter mucosalis]|uniref:SAM-dependent methyltransferase n=1 Tax=Campylobacter mucosalis CCUG 21559 TaxID=1032067 RepID=A0A6G5QI72_9BACT|nr:class I SAM-dependent methyltransferase [Campylobacter mucosalis]QCD45277.1 SAM-dependent methyltransferase [Campylobacter mucosalis CCUG 21559]
MLNNDFKFYKEQLKIWDKLAVKGDLIYPHEAVARFAAMTKPESVIDFGCATGRHLFAFANSGSKRLVGIDINTAPLEITALKFGVIKDKSEFRQGRFDLENASLELYSNEDRNLDEILGDFRADAVLCWGVLHLYHKDLAAKLLSDFKSQLKSGGEIFINLRSNTDGLKNEAVKIGENIYKITRKSHENLTYSFYSLDDLNEIFNKSGLKILSIDKEEFTQNNGKIFNSFWIVRAKKD